MIPFINFDEDFLTTEDLLFLAGASGGAPMVEYTATGNPATFETNVIKPLELLIPFNPVQDLHGYDSPWPAGGSPQRWDEEWEGGSISPSTGANANDNTRIRSKNYIPVLPSTVYYCKSSKDLALRYYGSDKSFIGTGAARNSTVTTPENCYYMRFAVIDTTSYGNDISINYPATETAYYSYSNICPISGWDSANVSRTGKNLLNLVSSQMESSGWDRFFPISLTDGTYIISCQNQFGASTKGAKVDLLDDGGNIVSTLISNYGFGDTVFVGSPTTIARETALKIKKIRFSCRAAGASFDDIAVGLIQIELGSTATAYEPYSGSTAEYEFPQEAGTVYGGTLTVNKDGTGTLVVDHECVDLGDLTWARSNSTKFFYATLLSIVPETDDIMCSEFTPISHRSTDAMDSAPIGSIAVRNSSRQILVRNEDYSSGSDFRDGVEGVQLVYPLTTPVTYQLTNQQVIETLKGVNNVWSDTNGVNTVKYMKKG